LWQVSRDVPKSQKMDASAVDAVNAVNEQVTVKRVRQKIVK
jgi:hypothetical protein